MTGTSTSTSTFLSYVPRHAPDSVGLTLDPPDRAADLIRALAVAADEVGQ